MQGVLSKYISRLRTNTAKYTDERVRLAGEAIAGSLAVKMLGQSASPLSTKTNEELSFTVVSTASKQEDNIKLPTMQLCHAPCTTCYCDILSVGCATQCCSHCEATT